MPSSYTQILLHVVFSTKRREPWIDAELEPRLHAFMGGIVRDEGGAAIIINGMPDHVHMLVRWKTDDTIANLMRNVKSRSSKWIHESFPAKRGFAWQKGFGCFSVSQSKKDAVVKYIQQQKVHHLQKSFRDEYLDMLKAHDVEYEERYAIEP